jgi:hypothetical protein
MTVPITVAQHEKKLHEPPLCEQLPVRDYLDNVVIRTNGAFVAAYELKGSTSYFASDEGRDRGKLMLEALLRSIPEQSMRVQIRYEVVEDVGDLLDQYRSGQSAGREVDNQRSRGPLHAAHSARVPGLGPGPSSPSGRKAPQTPRQPIQPVRKKVD